MFPVPGRYMYAVMATPDLTTKLVPLNGVAVSQYPIRPRTMGSAMSCEDEGWAVAMLEALLDARDFLRSAARPRHD
jgi:hypothetical protein